MGRFIICCSCRFFHQAVCSPVYKEIYVYGGVVKTSSGAYVATNEFWKFSIGPRMWTKLNVIMMYLQKCKGNFYAMCRKPHLYIDYILWRSEIHIYILNVFQFP